MPPMDQTHTSFLYFTVLWALFSPFQFGYHIAALNQLQLVLTCKSPPGATPTINGRLPTCIPMSDAMFGTVTSMYTVGGFAGSLIADRIMDRFGRRGAIKTNAFLVALGSAVMAASSSVNSLIVGRFIVGAGVGIGLCVAPIYLTEVSPPSLKGVIGVSNQLSVTVGLLVTQILGFLLAKPTTWRSVLLFSSGFSILQLLLSRFVFDTPAWLQSKGRIDDYKTASERLWGPEKSIAREDENDVEEALLGRNLDNGVPVQTEPLSILQLLRSADLRKSVSIVTLGMFAQQASGINAVIFYSNDILGKIIPTLAPYVSLLIAILNVLLTFPPIFLIERLGRRKILLSSMTSIVLAAVLLGFGLDAGFPWISSIAILLFVGAFAFGLGPIPFILMAELVPFYAVSPMSTIAISINWTVNFFIGVAFLPLQNIFGGEIFYGFALILGVCTLSLARMYRG